MSKRIDLLMFPELHFDTLEATVCVPGIRFRTKSGGWVASAGPAIIDTGAPLTFLPYSVWHGDEIEYQRCPDPIQVSMLGRAEIISMGDVHLCFEDDRGVSAPLKVRVLLGPAEWDDHPDMKILLGLKHVLAACAFFMQPASNTHFLLCPASQPTSTGSAFS